MAKTTRQTSIFGVEDWRKFYETFREADFQSYDFETLRKSFVDYLRLYYPETFNDYTESSEFIALLDLMAFMGQALAFRNDLNARENFLDTAERRDSVVRLSNLVGYTPKRNKAAEGFLKVFSVKTTEDITDFNGVNLSNVIINWNDSTNPNWLEQFTYIINAALVDSQKVGRPGNTKNILGVKTDEYTVNLSPGFLPVFPYSAIVDGINMPFEAVSATSQGADNLYEPAPQPSSEFNILYRNDQLGFGSANTGFFFMFKQGVLQSQSFTLSEAIPNRTVNINIEGVNNQDHWLYKLNVNGAIESKWQFVESIYSTETAQRKQRQLYSVVSRASDQITLTFGDGIFSEIPIGSFSVYVRASNGLKYVINPEEMQNVRIEIGYVSRVGRIETITFNCGITEPVSNAQTRESIDEIKQRAPARYYTQNRMVNGEDYNNFPFTRYNNIIKSKAVARSAIGTTRYTDLTDITSKYSSTNVFASDGVLYREYTVPSFDFDWTSRSDIVNVINTKIEPLLATRQMAHFYNENFSRQHLDSLNIKWVQVTTLINESTGYFVNQAGNVVSVSQGSNSLTRFIEPGALIKFVAPAGYFFNHLNQLVVGTPMQPGDHLHIWVTVTSLTGNGNDLPADANNKVGPVTINNFVPTNAIPVEVIPKFVNDLPPAIEQQILQQIELFRSFGVGYNHLEAKWYIISSSDLSNNMQFSLSYAGNKEGLNLDSSWLIRFTTNGGSYNVNVRGLDYVFASVIETRFFFDNTHKVYDTKTGKVVRDFIKVLKTNTLPDSGIPIANDLTMEIIDQPVESDGFKNNYKVLVSFADSDNDGVADDPDFFSTIVNPLVNMERKFVFLQKVTDFDNVETFVPVAADVINTLYQNKESIEIVKNEFVNGQIFYTTSTNEFYQLDVTLINGVFQRILLVRNDFIAKVGRQNIQFQYRHNSPLSNLIDPGITNIIDIYIVTQEYYTDYQNYIKDTTGSVKRPEPPTIAQLTTAYAGLKDFKMISDNIVVNSVSFKPLFGEKADTELRAKIKVIKTPGSTVSPSEIKSQVISNINKYFTIDNWDFGNSFFFSELSAYLHRQMGSLISSVVLVPVDPLSVFGDLYEIRSAPNEIFVSAATVDDVEVVDALTQSIIKSQAPTTGILK